MTFHSAKGLEFAACFLVGLEDHIIPHEKSLSQDRDRRGAAADVRGDDPGEKAFHLKHGAQTEEDGKRIQTTNPSRFLFEIPQDLISVSSWQTIA